MFGFLVTLLWRLAFVSMLGWSVPVVNGVVVVSSTFVAVLVIFIYLCEFVDS